MKKAILIIIMILISFNIMSNNNNDSINIDNTYSVIINDTSCYCNNIDTIKYIYKSDTSNYPSIIEITNIDGVKTKLFLFSEEEVHKINNTYRLVEMMEIVIEKSGISGDISVGLLNEKDNQIKQLNTIIKNKNSRISNREQKISELESSIDLLKENNTLCGEQNNKLKKQNENLQKDVDKQKRRKNIAIGGGILGIILAAIFL